MQSELEQGICHATLCGGAHDCGTEKNQWPGKQVFHYPASLMHAPQTCRHRQMHANSRGISRFLPSWFTLTYNAHTVAQLTAAEGSLLWNPPIFPLPDLFRISSSCLVVHKANSLIASNANSFQLLVFIAIKWPFCHDRQKQKCAFWSPLCASVWSFDPLLFMLDPF